MKFNLVKSIKGLTKGGKMRIKESSPEILIVAGIVGLVTSTVMACKATRKLDAILDEHQEETDRIHDYVKKKGYSEEYTEKDERRDIAITYRDTGLKVARLYAPAVLIGVASVACIFGGHKILRNRLITMSTLYNTTQKAFNDYKRKVAERLGEEEEKKLRYDIHQEEIVEEQENGKKKKQMVDVIDGTKNPAVYSPYAKFFDETSLCWERNAEYNLLFLNSQQRIANDQLKANGYLFLNTVYKMLGLRQTEAGQRVGWIYDEKNPVGDNYVDFGIYDLYKEKSRDFVNGYEKSILLDFNVDGDILTKAFAEKI